MKKIIALALVLVLAFSFAACKKDEGADAEKATAAPTGKADSLFENNEVEATTEVITNVDKDGNVVTEVVTEAAATDAQGKTLPSTKEEVVAYFNDAINNVKPNSKSITSNYMKHAVVGEVTGVPKAIDKVLGGTTKFVAGYMGEDESKANVTWSSTSDKNAYFPVEGESWASKLTADDVKEAQFVESDGKYLIRIKTKADPAKAEVSHGSGHAPKAFNVVLPSIIGDYIPGAVAKLFSIGTITMEYPSSQITVEIDPATGNVVAAEYIMYWTIRIPLGSDIVVLPFSTTNDYTINW